jgi:hypothetical protein
MVGLASVDPRSDDESMKIDAIIRRLLLDQGSQEGLGA